MAMSASERIKNLLQSIGQGISNTAQTVYHADLNPNVQGSQSIQGLFRQPQSSIDLNPFSQHSMQGAIDTSKIFQQSQSPVAQTFGNFGVNVIAPQKQAYQNVMQGPGQVFSALQQGHPLDALQGLTKTVYGVGQTVLPAVSPATYFGAQGVTALPNTHNSVLETGKQLTRGFLQGITGNESVGANVGDATTLPGKIANTVGNLGGFVQNPINKQLSGLLKGVNIPLKNPIASAILNGFVKGGTELSLQNLPNMPTTFTAQQKADFMKKNFLIGGAFGSALNLGEYGAGKLATSQVGNAMKERLATAYDELQRWTMPVKTEFQDMAGQRITVPQWRYHLYQKFGIPIDPREAQRGGINFGADVSLGSQPKLPEMGKVTERPVNAEATLKTRQVGDIMAQKADLKTTQQNNQEWSKAVFEQSRAQTPAQRLRTLSQKVAAAVKDNTVGADIPNINSVEANPRTQWSDVKDVVSTIAQSTRGTLQRMGTFGKTAAAKIDSYYNAYRQQAGTMVNDYTQATKGVDPTSLENIQRSLDGQKVVLTDAERTVATKLRGLLDTVAKDAQGARLSIDVNGQKLPWAPRENYLPHSIDLEKVKANPTGLISELVKSGQGDTQAATNFVDALVKGTPLNEAYHTFFNTTIPKKYGNLELGRLMNIPSEYLRYDAKLLPDYLAAASRRIAQAKEFGPNNEAVDQLLAGIQKEGGNTQIAKNAFDANFGVIPKDTLSGAMNTLRQFQGVTKLPTAAISNAGQSVNTATVFGIQNTLKAIASNGSEQARSFAAKTGTFLDSTLRDIENQMGQPNQGWLGKLTAPGMKKVEVFNRVVAANAGKSFTEQAFEKLLKNPTDSLARRQLLKMGLDPETLLKAGQFTENDLVKAAQKAVDITQFKVDQIDLPPGWSSSFGKLVTQFKSFAYKQGDFVLNEVLKEARHGNLAPMGRYILTGTIVGEGIADVKSLIGHKDRPTDPLARIADNLTYTGGFGLLRDAISSIGYGSKGVAQFVLGPTLSEPLRFADSLQSIQKFGDWKPLAKEGLYLTPLIGSTAAKWIFPSTQPGNSGEMGVKGKTLVAGSTVADRKKQNSAIQQALDGGKPVENSALAFHYLYETDHLPSGGRYETLQKADAYLKTYEQVTKDQSLSDAQKQFLIGKIQERTGVSVPQMEYYKLAGQQEDNRYGLILDKIDGMQSRSELLHLLMLGREKVNDKMVVTSGILTRLEDDGYISTEEAKYLKQASYKNGQLTSNYKGSGKKVPKVTVKKVSLPVAKRPTFGKTGKTPKITLQSSKTLKTAPLNTAQLVKGLKVKV